LFVFFGKRRDALKVLFFDGTGLCLFYNQHVFQSGTVVTTVRDAASLLQGSPQAGVTKTSSSTASGRLISRTTMQGKARLEYMAFTVDRLGRTSSMTRYQDAAGGTNFVTSSMHFDSLGQLIELDEPDSPPQLRTYSNWRELLSTSRTIQTSGAAASGVSSSARTDATTGSSTALTVVNTYDALGRLTHTENRRGGVADPGTVDNYLYDVAVNVAPQVTPTNMLGRLSQASSPTGAVSFSYDGLGQIAARVFTDVDGGMYVEARTSHGDGTPLALDLFLPDTGYADEHVDYPYDSAGRQKSIRYANGSDNEDLFEATMSARYGGVHPYDSLGRLRQAQYGLTSYSATYADTGRRLLTQALVSSAKGSRSLSFAGYDPLGRERTRSEVKDEASTGTTITSAYDALGQLSSSAATSGSSTLFNQQFSYDALGNLRTLVNSGTSTATNVATSYLSTDRDRICRISYGADTGTACNVTYDELGSITAMPTQSGTRELSYLVDGQVSTITDGRSTATYRYDAFGEVQELDVESNRSSDTRHDRRLGDLLALRDEVSGISATSVLLRKIPGADGVVATRHGAVGFWTFEFGEDRGTRFVTDETGAFVQDIDYLPYGGASSTGAQPGSSLYSNEQWNGGDALTALGVSQLGARIYDPLVGRFLSRDPLLAGQTAVTTNPYAFAANDPVNASDPTGLRACGSDFIGKECTDPGDDGKTIFWDVGLPGYDGAGAVFRAYLR
jgi:RHS repeat-associated protein